MRINTTIDDISNAISENLAMLTEASIDQGDVNAEELLEYFSGDTPTGDKTTIDDVISNPWLLLHELAELKHLKLRGFVISRKLVWDNYLDVLEAHIAATGVELKMATKHGDREWVSMRVQLIPTWLEDPEISETLRNALQNLLDSFL